MNNKENWKIALQKFIKKWGNRKEVVGAIACGSYITGKPNKHSDIDIHIILDPKTAWRERGNEIIDGILVEYFANPAKKHYVYIKGDYKQRRKANAHMFCTGKVLFDKTGELKKLIQYSRKYLNKKYQIQKKFQIESAKYGIWDMRDNLEEVFESDSGEFYFVFYNSLNKLFDIYSGFLRHDSIPANKFKRFLVNDADKKKYRIADFPDKNFVKIAVSAINIKDKRKMMNEYRKLTDYVLKKMGGFDIDGWKLRSPAK